MRLVRAEATDTHDDQRAAPSADTRLAILIFVAIVNFTVSVAALALAGTSAFEACGQAL
jgi:hypothetical protein